MEQENQHVDIVMEKEKGIVGNVRVPVNFDLVNAIVVMEAEYMVLRFAINVMAVVTLKNPVRNVQVQVNSRVIHVEKQVCGIVQLVVKLVKSGVTVIMVMFNALHVKEKA
jgi:hypothetical protein